MCGDHGLQELPIWTREHLDQLKDQAAKDAAEFRALFAAPTRPDGVGVDNYGGTGS